MQQNAQRTASKSQPKSSVKEGETVIDKAPKNHQESKNSVGEYVDYEEVD